MSWNRQTISRAILTMALVAMLCGGCARRQGYIRPVDAGRKGPPATCIALSVGGADGLVHVGAIQAAKDAGIDISCVAGTSMGALIGALYASAPDTDLEVRVSALLKRYRRSVKKAKKKGGALGAALAGAVVLVSGGTALPVVAAAGLGAAVGAGAVPKVDIDRLGKVLDRHIEKTDFADLPIRFYTFYFDNRPGHFTIRNVSSGNVAAAVKRSIANPHIFKSFDAVMRGYLDPGVDRMAQVPVQDLCALRPDVQILAINVTGRPSVYDSALPCPVLEVMIDPSDVDTEAAIVNPKIRRKLFEIGYEATAAALN